MSQSHFLQSLGWATLNSFWQMALLWCIYIAARHFLKLSAHNKYQLSVAAIITGFVWFVFTFISFYQNSFGNSYAFFDTNTVSHTNNILNIFLISASAAYLALLVFPTYRLLKNWKFVQRLKKDGLKKADLEYRLFTQKATGFLGITKKVKVFVSEIVSSPVTIGYLKPIILLPVAALNNLTPSQVEAILLHELSHIKRYDYLFNFIVNIIYTLLYFNPFVKQFMKEIETERENCCDELVLQFGYDKISYASALLTLEKVSAQHRILALGATGRKNLLTRIEKIVGMEKKKGYSLAQFVPVLAALICILAFNSVLIIKDSKKSNNFSLAYNSVVNPFHFIEGGGSATPVDVPVTNPIYQHQPDAVLAQTTIASVTPTVKPSMNITIQRFTDVQDIPVVTPSEEFIQVGYDEIDGSLTTEQKDQVKTTVDATKKVLSTLQWKQVEATLADALNKEEKAIVKQEYLKELDNMNWKRIEQNLKANYEKMDWNNINVNLTDALTVIQLDSLQLTYKTILNQLEKAESEIAVKGKTCITPIPDASVAQYQKAKEDIRKNLEEVKSLRKKVIKL